VIMYCHLRAAPSLGVGMGTPSRGSGRRSAFFRLKRMGCHPLSGAPDLWSRSRRPPNNMGSSIVMVHSSLDLSQEGFREERGDV